MAAVQTWIYVAMTHRQQRYLHEKEAGADVVRDWTHPDVTVLLQILRCYHCFRKKKKRERIKNDGEIIFVLFCFLGSSSHGSRNGVTVKVLIV